MGRRAASLPAVARPALPPGGAPASAGAQTSPYPAGLPPPQTRPQTSPSPFGADHLIRSVPPPPGQF